jgi:hypothetical protein
MYCVPCTVYCLPSRLNSPRGDGGRAKRLGRFGKDRLVGNFGDGRINAIDLESGRFGASCRDNTRRLPSTASGGLGFGNGATAGRLVNPVLHGRNQP